MRPPRITCRIAPLVALILACACSRDSSPTDPQPGQPVLSKSNFWVFDTLLYADGVSSTPVGLVLYDQDGNQLLSAPGPVVFKTTTGSISAVTHDYGSFDATLTSTVGDATATVTAEVNGQPVPFALTAHFVTHRVWDFRAGIDCCRYGMISGTVNGIIYATGGYTEDYDGNQTFSGAMEAYDPAANSWALKAFMPDARYGYGVAALNGLLYVMGGYMDSVATNSVITYDPASDTWSSAAPMPTARANLGVSVVGGLLYAVGGDTGSGALDVVEAYDPATKTWTTRAPMPSARTRLAAGAVNGILYAVGGNPDPSSTVYAYDPATNSWAAKASMPTGRTGLSAGALGTKLYALGADFGSFETAFELYDPATNTWSVEPSMPLLSNGAGSAVVNGSLYAVGASGSAVLMYVP